MTYKRHFWYDGHHGEVVMLGRARYESRLNGEKFEQGGSPTGMKDALIEEMKYRVERKPDFPMVCYGLVHFLNSVVPGRNDENEWALFDSVQEEVILNDHGLALGAMYECEHAGLIEKTKAYDTPNYDFLLRPTTQGMPDPKELQGMVSNERL